MRVVVALEDKRRDAGKVAVSRGLKDAERRRERDKAV